MTFPSSQRRARARNAPNVGLSNDREGCGELTDVSKQTPCSRSDQPTATTGTGQFTSMHAARLKVRF